MRRVCPRFDTKATVILSSDWDPGPLPPLSTTERALTHDANAVFDVKTAVPTNTIDSAYGFGHDDINGPPKSASSLTSP